VAHGKRLRRNGHNSTGNQRYYCFHCGKYFVETRHTPLSHSRLDHSVVEFLAKSCAEGVSIRALSRMTGFSRTPIIYFEPCVDPLFYEDSYGYRPNKSVKQALVATRERCWRKDFILEFDIKALFDNIRHDYLMEMVKKHAKGRWVVL